MAQKDTRPTWLKEVQLAAKYNYFKNLKDFEERQRVKKAKEEGTLDELVEKELAERKKAEDKRIAAIEKQSKTEGKEGK